MFLTNVLYIIVDNIILNEVPRKCLYCTYFKNIYLKNMNIGDLNVRRTVIV